jgi:O-antigen ligase
MPLNSAARILSRWGQIQAHATTGAQWAVLALCFSAGVSRGLFALSAFLLFFGWVLSSSWRRLALSRISLVWLALITWMYVSSLWSEGTWSTVSHSMGVQWKLLLIPAIATLSHGRLFVDRCWLAFAAGMAVLLLHVYALTFVNIPWTATQEPSGVFFNPLPQSIGIAIFTAWCIHQSLKATPIIIKFALILGIFAGTYAVLVISTQRLGYVSLFLGVVTVLARDLPPKMRLWGVSSLIISTILMAGLNPQIQKRLEQATQDVQSYNLDANYSSVGARLHMWVISFRAILEAPIAGHGIGSYPIVSEQAFRDSNMCAIGCDHPHNQYLYYALEFGLVGLGLFLLAITLAVRSWRDPPQRSTMTMAALLVFLTVGLADTTLWYRGYLHLFVPLLGMATAVLRREL